MADEEGCCLSLTGWLGIGALTLAGVWIWRKCRVYSKFKNSGTPGPKPVPFFGNILDTFKYGVIDQSFEYYKTYGKVYGVYTFFKPGLFISDLDMIREVFVKKFHLFPDRETQGNLNYKPWKDILLSLKGDHWKHVRSQLSPIFSSGKLKRMIPAIQRVTQSLREHLQTKAESGEPIELKELSGHYAMDVFAGVSYSIELDTIKNPNDKFLTHANQIIRPSSFMITLMLLAPKLFSFLSKHGYDLGFKDALDFFLSVSETSASERSQGNEKRGDFIQMLVEAEREGKQGPIDPEINHESQLVTSSTWTRKGLTSDEIHSNAFLFLLAGYDTVSTVLSFTLFLLAMNPECQRSAQAEVDKVLGKKAVDYESAQELTYLDMCINESMRLYAPGFIVNRVALEDTEVGGMKIEKGETMWVPIAAIHRDPEIWPDPLTFDPLRHTPEAKATRHPFAYMPFGMGPRNCIGMRLAQMEVRMAVATVMQNFNLIGCDKTVNPPKMAKMRLTAQDGLWVKVLPR